MSDTIVVYPEQDVIWDYGAAQPIISIEIGSAQPVILLELENGNSSDH